MADGSLVVLCTAPAGGEVAVGLARGLVEAGLAACVNLVPAVRSLYRWQGKLCDDAEVLLIIKTRRERFEAVREWLSREHPYEVPEVVALPIEAGAPSYLAWLAAQVGLG
jgi:periplasmic divalent cation tolerance protein